MVDGHGIKINGCTGLYYNFLMTRWTDLQITLSCHNSVDSTNTTRVFARFNGSGVSPETRGTHHGYDVYIVRNSVLGVDMDVLIVFLAVLHTKEEIPVVFTQIKITFHVLIVHTTNAFLASHALF